MHLFVHMTVIFIKILKNEQNNIFCFYCISLYMFLFFISVQTSPSEKFQNVEH